MSPNDLAEAGGRPDPGNAADSLVARLCVERAYAAAARNTRLNLDHNEIRHLRAQIDAIHASTGWRVLGPLRAAGRRFPGAARLLRGALRLIWRTVRLWRGAERAALRRRAATDGASAGGDLRDAFIARHGAQAIAFPLVATPAVSIVIPAYKGLADLQACLRSLVVTLSSEPPFEVIVVDDEPADPVLPAIPDSPGLIKIANADNLGFLLTCNRGAAPARGRFLCFLNSDTIVNPGWLAALVQAADETPAAALIGGMLLNRDGTVQSAGWRILDDGWGQPIGRGGDPRDGAYTYRRSADCVTGACFLIARATFDALGGFDPAYAPAFYEEFDLAFRARARGLTVLYEPRSKVVHLGSASYGAARRDELSVINHARFVARFAETLGGQPWDAADEFALRGMGGSGPVVLVIDEEIPRPDRSAGGVTISLYLGLLAAAGWRVVFGPMDGAADGPAAEALEQHGIELIRAPRTIASWLAAHGSHVRHVWVARPHIAEHLIAAIRSHTTAKVAYYTHDLHHLRMQRGAALGNDPALAAKAERMRATELAVFAAVDHITAPSEAECDVIARTTPGTPISMMPPFFYEGEQARARAAAHFTPLSDVVFVGGFPHAPNVDAALFAEREIMPLVWRVAPSARLVLVGYAPPPEVQALACPRVVVTGQVPEIAPYLDAARVFLAPLRYGAGVKGKIVDALALGVPVITTAIGAEGIGLETGRTAIVAEGPAALAQAVLLLLQDAAACAAFSQAGVELVRRRFSRLAAREAIARVFDAPRCGVCGSGRIVPPSQGGLRSYVVCSDCRASAATEAAARVVLARLARGGESSLVELASRRPELRMLELGGESAIGMPLRSWPGFATTAFGADRLSYPDATFDAVVAHGVPEGMELNRACVEIARVLRRGGACIVAECGCDLRHAAEAVGLRVKAHTMTALGGAPGRTTRVLEASRP